MKKEEYKNKRIYNRGLDIFEETNCNKEFITSYFKWKTLDEQKKRGKELEDSTYE